MARIPPLPARRAALRSAAALSPAAALGLAAAIGLAAALGLAAAIGLAGGCGDAGVERPRPLLLARAFLDAVPAATEDAGAAGAGAAGPRLRPDGLHAWLEIDVARADWRPDGPGLWRAPRVPLGRGKPSSGEPPQRLVADGRAFDSSPIGRLAERGPASFALDADSVVLRLAPGEPPPARARLSVFCERAVPASRGWTVRGRRYSGLGLAVWPGEAVESRQRVPADSTLRFATVAEPVVHPPAGGATRFRVLADGEVLLEHELAAVVGGASAWHALDLAALGGRDVLLRFEVDGAPAHSSFLAPSLGPSDPGGYADRAWERERPDLVLFVADTLRADALGAYGGGDGVTPFLDRLAERSLVFTEARSTSTYTLPSHSSMFTGLFPHQVRVRGTGYALPDDVRTIAELLADAGYRTGAVTDSLQVSRKYGLDQGFEWFDERPSGLEATLARAADFLDADDGRPVFLFAHTYRVHLPYTVTPETMASHGDRLGIAGDFEDLRARLAEAQQQVLEGDAPREAAREAARLARRLRAHYLGGVVDLDRGVERFWRDLERRGLLESGYALFTSDHGEAFYEHGLVYHTGKVWEELVRVPMMLSGPALEPARVPSPASLVDLPPTLADLAGLAPLATWEGTSLLELPEERPVFSFESYHHRRPDATLSVVEGSRKVIGYEEPGRVAERGVFAAFDLATDPGERRDLSGAEAWPRELLERMAPVFESLLQPVVEEREATIDAGTLEELRAMGYVED